MRFNQNNRNYYENVIDADYREVPTSMSMNDDDYVFRGGRLVKADEVNGGRKCLVTSKDPCY